MMQLPPVLEGGGPSRARFAHLSGRLRRFGEAFVTAVACLAGSASKFR